MAQIRNALGGILAGGVAAGTFDIVYAMIAAAMRGRPATRSVQAVASGILGASAFDGGWRTFALGLALHFFIAIAFAAVYFGASTRVTLLRTSVVVPAIVFGVSVYLFMNFVVLPLSAVPFTLKYSWTVLAIGFLSHTLLIGLPIALATTAVWRRASSAV